MKKYKCTAQPQSTVYYVVVIHEDEERAIQLSRVEAKERWGSSVAGARWSAAYVDSGYSPPPRVVDYGKI